MHSFIFFDLDGTLTDPQEGITASIRHALLDAGAPIPEPARLLDCIGPPLQESFADLLGTSEPSALARALAKYRQRFEDVGMFENRVYEGIREALEELRGRGYLLCVATSKPQVYAHRILEHFDLLRYFHHVFGPDLDGTRRDKSILLAHALEVTGAVAERCLMIGDRKHDVLGAKHNGIRALGVTWGFGGTGELRTAGADGLVDLVSDLVDAIAQGHPSPL